MLLNASAGSVAQGPYMPTVWPFVVVGTKPYIRSWLYTVDVHNQLQTTGLLFCVLLLNVCVFVRRKRTGPCTSWSARP